MLRLDARWRRAASWWRHRLPTPSWRVSGWSFLVLTFAAGAALARLGVDLRDVAGPLTVVALAALLCWPGLAGLRRKRTPLGLIWVCLVGSGGLSCLTAGVLVASDELFGLRFRESWMLALWITSGGLWLSLWVWHWRAAPGRRVVTHLLLVVGASCLASGLYCGAVLWWLTEHTKGWLSGLGAAIGLAFTIFCLLWLLPVTAFYCFARHAMARDREELRRQAPTAAQ